MKLSEVFKDELLAEGCCPWCAGPLLPLPLDGHADCVRRAIWANYLRWKRHGGKV